MAIHEALSLIVNKSKLEQTDKQEYTESFTVAGIQYLFDCYDRVEEEKRQYPKVKKKFFKLIISTNLIATFIIYRGVILLKFQQY